MVTKPGIADLSGTFLETVKPSGESLADQLRQLNRLSVRRKTGGPGQPVVDTDVDWETLVIPELASPRPTPSAPQPDPTVEVLRALATHQGALSTSELLQQTRLNVTQLMTSINNGMQFGLVRRLDGDPPRFALTSEGSAVYQSVQAE